MFRWGNGNSLLKLFFTFAPECLCKIWQFYFQLSPVQSSLSFHLTNMASVSTMHGQAAMEKGVMWQACTCLLVEASLLCSLLYSTHSFSYYAQRQEELQPITACFALHALHICSIPGISSNHDLAFFELCLVVQIACNCHTQWHILIRSFCELDFTLQDIMKSHISVVKCSSSSKAGSACSSELIA